MKRLIPFDWERRLGYDREVKSRQDLQPKPGPLASPFSCVAVPVPRRPDGAREARYVRQAVERANRECIMKNLTIADLQRANEELRFAIDAREHEICLLQGQLDRALTTKIHAAAAAREAEDAEEAEACARATHRAAQPEEQPATSRSAAGTTRRPASSRPRQAVAEASEAGPRRGNRATSSSSRRSARREAAGADAGDGSSAGTEQEQEQLGGETDLAAAASGAAMPALEEDGTGGKATSKAAVRPATPEQQQEKGSQSARLSFSAYRARALQGESHADTPCAAAGGDGGEAHTGNVYQKIECPELTLQSGRGEADREQQQDAETPTFPGSHRATAMMQHNSAAASAQSSKGADAQEGEVHGTPATAGATAVAAGREGDTHQQQELELPKTKGPEEPNASIEEERRGSQLNTEVEQLAETPLEMPAAAAAASGAVNSAATPGAGVPYQSVAAAGGAAAAAAGGAGGDDSVHGSEEQLQEAIRKQLEGLQLLPREEVEAVQGRLMDRVQQQLEQAQRAHTDELNAVKAENRTLRQLHDILNEKAELDARRVAELEARNVRLEYDLLALSEEVEDIAARLVAAQQAVALLQGGVRLPQAFGAGLPDPDVEHWGSLLGSTKARPVANAAEHGAKSGPTPSSTASEHGSGDDDDDDPDDESSYGDREGEEDSSQADSHESLVFKSPSVVPSLDLSKLALFNSLANSMSTTLPTASGASAKATPVGPKPPPYASKGTPAFAGFSVAPYASAKAGSGAGGNGTWPAASGAGREYGPEHGLPPRPAQLTAAVVQALSGTSQGASGGACMQPGGALQRQGSSAAASEVSLALSSFRKSAGAAPQPGLEQKAAALP